jgi:hypothetical protein
MRPKPAVSPWLELWKRSFDLSTRAPEVVAHRLRALQRTPWAPATLIESNVMVWEKIAAMQESWWSLWRDATAFRWPATRMKPTATNLWLLPFSTAPHSHVARSASRALQPLARRVNANRTRLRRAAASR